MKLRFVVLTLLLAAGGCPRPEATPTAEAPRRSVAKATPPETCEAFAAFHDSTHRPNAFALATVRTKYRDCTPGPCQTRVDVHPFHVLRGPEFEVTEGGLPHASAQRLTERPDDHVLVAAHVDADGAELVWAYPLHYAAEGEPMLRDYDGGKCPPVRLPRDPSCGQCQPDDCATGCCKWEQFGCGPAKTCADIFDCEPKCCE